MRVAFATVLAVLATAAPASAITGGTGITDVLRGTHLVLADSGAKATKTRTCQAGKHRAAGSSNLLIGDKGKPGVVACEQPPRSSYSPETIAKATAAALSILG
jgi:hypothetical protein